MKGVVLLISLAWVGCASALNAPSNLTSGAVSPSQINLTWRDNADKEQGFQVFQSRDGTHYNKIATVGRNVTKYHSKGLLTRTRYFYKVRAVNGFVLSGWSNASSAMTQTPTPSPTPSPTASPPATPQPTTPSPTPTPSPPNPTPTGTPTPTISPSASPSPTASLTPSPSATPTPLPTGTPTPITPTPTAVSTPSASPTATATPPQTSSVTATWDDDGRGNGYRIYYGTQSGQYGPAIEVGKTTSWVVSGLTLGQQYYFALTAYNSAGESEKSPEVAYKPLSSKPGIIYIKSTPRKP